MDNISFERSRVVGFSDAVFSVAMTLLVLEVAVPSYQSVNKYGTWEVLADRIPNFIGFVVSFFVTALYWIDYLKITKYVSDFDMKTLWINIFLLFFIVLLPFSTAFYVNGINFIGPFVFYSINLTMIAVMILLLILAVNKKEKGVTGLTPLITKWESLKMLNTTSVWFLAAILAFVNLPTARIVFVLIFIFNPLIDRYFSKRVEKSESY